MGQSASSLKCFTHDEGSIKDKVSVNASVLIEGMAYPMWVLPVAEFFQQPLGKPDAHQELMEEGKLVKYTTTDMFCIFASHQWLSNSHPDPQGLQLGQLRGALKGLSDNTIEASACIEIEVVFQIMKSLPTETKARIRTGYLWYDWFGIPQITIRRAVVEDVKSEMIKAVNSVPAYVAACELFVVVAPPLIHENTRAVCDVASWRIRGWCRTELSCRALSARANSDEILLVRSATDVKFINGIEWMFNPPCCGNFTIESDKANVHPVIKKAIDEKIAFEIERVHLERATLFWFRFYQGMRGKFLSGHGDSSEYVADSSQAFLNKYRFVDLTDKADKGWSPIMCAAHENNGLIMKQILAARVNVDSRVEVAIPELFIMGGETPLHIAAMFSSMDAAKVLVEAKADLGSRANFLTSPLMNASLSYTNVDMAEFLLDSRSDPNLCNGINTNPAYTAVMWGGQPDSIRMLELLLERGARWDGADIFGSTILHWVALFSGDHKQAELLIKHGVDVNAVGQAATLKECLILAGTRLASKFGVETEFVKYFTECKGSTALHPACLFGRIELVKVLLTAKADTTTRNYIGHTGLDLARVSQQPELIQLLEKNAAEYGIVPCRAKVSI